MNPHMMALNTTGLAQLLRAQNAYTNELFRKQVKAKKESCTAEINVLDKVILYSQNLYADLNILMRQARNLEAQSPYVRVAISLISS